MRFFDSLRRGTLAFGCALLLTVSTTPFSQQALADDAREMRQLSADGPKLSDAEARALAGKPAEAIEPEAGAPLDGGFVEATDNYVFATTTSGNLVDMSAGTTQILAANLDDTASAVTPIGFDFVFQGAVYSQFSANSNGLIRLGPTVVQNAGPYKPLGQAGQALISAYGADQRTHTSGRVHFRVDGTAPNRVLVVEFLNMQANWNAGGTADLTYQVLLSETTGQIEFRYGAMAMSTLGAADANSRDPHIGFSSGSVAGTIGTVTAPQSGAPAPTYDGNVAPPVANLYVAGPIDALTSAADGARRTFTFTAPPAPTAPTGLSFSGVGATSLTIEWVDSPNEIAYVIYRSTDGVNFSVFGAAPQDATSFLASGLSPSTSYTWRVHAASEGALSAPLQGVQGTNPPANILSTPAGGNWSATTTWVGGQVPTSDDNVTISDGSTVVIDTAAVALNLTVGTGGASATLEWESAVARTLVLGGNATIAANGIFRSAAAGTVVTHALTVPGNLTNNGVLDFSTNGDTAGAGIVFTGATPATFGGSGATTDLRALTVNKGAQANQLDLEPANLTVRGVDTDVAGFLTLTSGTLRIGGTYTVTNRLFTTATYTIPAAAGLWLDNPNFTVAATASGTTTNNNGLLRISQGTYNVGLTGAHGLGGGAGAIFDIQGGTLNAPRVDPQNAVVWNQSGGTVNIGTIANTRTGFGAFELFSTASTFTMSGGTINLVQASIAATPIDWNVRSTTFSATGGVVNIGTAATATNFNFRIRANLPDFVIDNTGNPKTATATAQVNLRGTSTISAGSSLVINGQVALVIGPSFVNNGTLNGTALNTRFYFLGGAGPTVYSGSGTVVAPLRAWEVDNVAGVTIDPSVNQIAALRFNNFSGGLTGSGKLTLGDGGATSAVVQLGVATPSAPAFGFDVSPIFNPGTGGVINIYAQELSARTTGPELPPSRTLTTLSVSNTNGLTIDGGDITVVGTGAGALTMTNATVATGSNTLVFDSATGTVVRTLAGYVDGNFRKTYAAAGAKTFEVGTANGYTPVIANATAGTFPASITVAAVQGKAPQIAPADLAIDRHWVLAGSDVDSADVTFSYLDPADLPVTVTEADLVTFRRVGGTFTDLGGTIDTGANTMAVAGVTTFGLFTLAEPGATVQLEADLSITKTDGVTTVTPGSQTTYTIVASNAVGPDPIVGATVADTFPASLTGCTWTCSGSAGGSCGNANGAGNISELVDLPVGGSVTFLATCTVDLAATGTIDNTATVAVPSGAFDPDTDNNSATDSNTVDLGGPEIGVSPGSFSFTVTTGSADAQPLTISNSGTTDLVWDIETDTLFGQPVEFDPALNEVLSIPNFSVASAPNGGTPFVAVVPAGVLTSGRVVGFSFQGTVSGITGNSSWAADLCMRVEGPDGSNYTVGGFSTSIPNCAVNPWDFDGSGSNNDGTYASSHEDVFPFPPGADDAGNWTITFINGWDSASAATMNWSNVTVTLHKETMPTGCSSPNVVSWLMADPDSGTTGAGLSSVSSVMVDADGLAVGSYEAFLCVNSNDGDDPLVVVPVTLDVVAPSITVAPTEIVASVAASGQSTTETLTIGNTGAGDLFWEIQEAPAGAANPQAHFPLLPRQVLPGQGVASLVAEPIDAARAAKLALEVPRGAPERDRRSLFGGAAVPAFTTTGFSRSDYVTFDALVPGSLTSIVDPGPATIFAQTFIGDNFSQHFFIATSGGALAQNAYGYIDTATGAVNQLGVLTGVPASGTWTSAAWDRTNGQVYAVLVPGGGNNQLYRIDVAAGTGTLVGSISGGGLPANAIVIAIAVSPDGLMYGIEIQNDVLFAIDKTSGAAAVIGPTGVNANFAQDMDFDPSTGTLYWAGYQGGGNSQMFTVDTTTGAATSIGAVAGGAELLSFSVAIAGGNCSDPADVPWLSVDAASGTVPSGGPADEVQVSLNSTGLVNGVYEASLCVLSNDPARPLVEVPVEFTVGATTADLGLSLFGVPSTVNAGGSLSLAASVANFGPAAATGVSVVLDLPDDFTFVSGSLIEGSGNWNCSATGQVVTCNLVAGSLPVGSFAAVLQVNVSVAPDAEDGVVQTTGTVSGSQPDPNPGNNTGTVNTTIIGGPVDVIFQNGFECAPGLPGCASGGTPGVYTDRTTFLQNVQGGHFEEDFAGVPVGTAIPSLSFSGNGFAYTITAIGGGTQQLYNDPGIISHDSAVDAIRITFTGAPVTAIGGNFWGTDITFTPNGGQITLTLADSTTVTYASTGPSNFRGFVTTTPIAHITIDAADVPANSWSTVDNVIAGAR
ncbi:MAG: DUF11 domain-containing protein [Xanthomonadales bacterium]|nr:DUF11 domain-containing protein [Xanthomonadales bacterium]